MIMGYAVVICGFAAVAWDKNYKSIVIRLRNAIKTVIWLSVNRGLENMWAHAPSHVATVVLLPLFFIDLHLSYITCISLEKLEYKLFQVVSIVASIEWWS